MRKWPRRASFNYLYGLINLVVVFCLVWLLWYVFMHADGVMKLYTPMYGFSLVTLLFASVVLLVKVIGWPARPEEPLDASAAVTRGIIGTVLSLALMFILNYVVFWGLIGPFGIAYFSPDALVAAGGTGAEPWNAREWSSTAIIYFATAFLWWALVWDLGFRALALAKRPAHRWRASASFSRCFFWPAITHFVLFHPHVCLLFPEAQKDGRGQGLVGKLGRDLQRLLRPGPGALHPVLGGVLRAVLGGQALGTWFGPQGRRQPGLGGWSPFSGPLMLGIILVWVLWRVFNGIWEEPFVGGQYTDGPDWRYMHMAEVSGFFILSAYIWKYYFNNWPNKMPLIVKGHNTLA